MAREAGSVLVVGGANLDRLARSAGPLRLHTSNPGTAREVPGGVARNVAENLARLGTPTRLVLAVGEDRAGRRVLEATQAAGVETIEVPWSGPTGSYTALLDHDGALVAGVADMTATDSLTLTDLPEDLVVDLVSDAAWLVLDGNLSTATLVHALRLAGDADVPVVLDPVSAPKAAALAELVVPDRQESSRIHTLTPTRDELEALTGEVDPERGAASLHARGVEVVWIRSGEAGSVLHRRGRPPERVRLPVVPAVDVTGAGDAMLAAYVDALWQGRDLVDAAWAGAAAAALTVASPMTVRPDLTRDLIRHTLQEDHR